MSTKFKKLKNDLQDLENETQGSELGRGSDLAPGNSKMANYFLVVAFVATLIFYAGSRMDNFFSNPDNPIANALPNFGGYSPELLDDMGAMMSDMGYGDLSHEELSDLRDEGVTATETQRLHDLGYTDITLNQLVQLRDAGISASDISGFQDVGYTDITINQLVEVGNADASTTYARMMKELGYDFTMEDLAETRRNGVTAYFTSRMMDLGYTIEELTKENLIRLRSVDVSDSIARRLTEERGERPSIEELIRYMISNQ